MKCPFCGYTESKVIDSRPAEGYTMIRRRRGMPLLPETLYHL